jgi:hypothetical protein
MLSANRSSNLKAYLEKVYRARYSVWFLKMFYSYIFLLYIIAAFGIPGIKTFCRNHAFYIESSEK